MTLNQTLKQAWLGMPIPLLRVDYMAKALNIRSTTVILRSCVRSSASGDSYGSRIFRRRSLDPASVAVIHCVRASISPSAEAGSEYGLHRLFDSYFHWFRRLGCSFSRACFRREPRIQDVLNATFSRAHSLRRCVVLLSSRMAHGTPSCVCIARV